VLYVFMPPLARLEDYLDLVAAVEATARDAGREHRDGRLPAAARPAPEDAAVTPDPGVIEVNIHPAAQLEANWSRTPSSSTTPRSKRACRPRSS
jgi:uncharacterized protein (DUF2126 family)